MALRVLWHIKNQAGIPSWYSISWLSNSCCWLFIFILLCDKFHLLSDIPDCWWNFMAIFWWREMWWEVTLFAQGKEPYKDALWFFSPPLPSNFRNCQSVPAELQGRNDVSGNIKCNRGIRFCLLDHIHCLHYTVIKGAEFGLVLYCSWCGYRYTITDSPWPKNLIILGW